MIKPGLVSVTFRACSCQQIIQLVENAGLKGIEWGGDVHVPHGNIETAKRINQQMREADLETAAYGSYYQLGKSEQDGLSFSLVLETAVALGASLIRVWAGDRDAEKAEDAYIREIIEESRRIADMAAAKEVQIAYEFHENTLTNTAESCRDLLLEVDHSAVGTYWQPIIGRDAAKNAEDIEMLLPWITGFHVFHWKLPHKKRFSLDAGQEEWIRYLEILKKTGTDIYGLIEFVKEDRVDLFQQDANAFLTLLEAALSESMDRDTIH